MAKQGIGESSEGQHIFKRNTVDLALMQVAKYAFPLITLPYLARTLGPDTYAIRAYTVSYMVFMSALIDYGFLQYGTKYVASHLKDVEAITKINTEIYWAKTLMFVVASFVTLVFASFVPIMNENKTFVLVSLLSTALKGLLPDFVLQGLRNMRAIALRFTIAQALVVVLIFSLVHSQEQLLLVPILEGLTALFALIWTQIYLKKRYGIGITIVYIYNIVHVIKKSTSFFLAVASSAFMSSIVTVMMGFFALDEFTLACWSISTTVIQGIQALWQPVSRSLFPHMVIYKDTPLISKLLKFGFPATLMISLICYFLSDYIMLLMGGAEYITGSYVLRLIAPMIVFSYPISILGYPVIGAIGKSSYLSICVAVTGGIQFLILLIAGLVGFFNIQIIAAARCGTEALLCLLEFFFATRILRAAKSDAVE
jgi:PST family polysaccharide transporter